jgi:hypothetical protein
LFVPNGKKLYKSKQAQIEEFEKMKFANAALLHQIKMEEENK